MALHETGSTPVNEADPASHSASRALVPLAQSQASERHVSHFRHIPAAFLAHLIATKQNEPQTRQLRRMAPEIAARAYAATAAIKNG